MNQIQGPKQKFSTQVSNCGASPVHTKPRQPTHASVAWINQLRPKLTKAFKDVRSRLYLIEVDQPAIPTKRRRAKTHET